MGNAKVDPRVWFDACAEIAASGKCGDGNCAGAEVGGDVTVWGLDNRGRGGTPRW